MVLNIASDLLLPESAVQAIGYMLHNYMCTSLHVQDYKLYVHHYKLYVQDYKLYVQDYKLYVQDYKLYVHDYM